MNNNCVSRRYDCAFQDKFVLIVQKSQNTITHKQCFLSVVCKLLCSRPTIYYVWYLKSPSESPNNDIIPCAFNKGLVINYGEGGGLPNGKIAGLKLFAPTPLKTG